MHRGGAGEVARDTNHTTEELQLLDAEDAEDAETQRSSSEQAELMRNEPDETLLLQPLGKFLKPAPYSGGFPSGLHKKFPAAAGRREAGVHVLCGSATLR